MVTPTPVFLSTVVVALPHPGDLGVHPVRLPTSAEPLAFRRGEEGSYTFKGRADLLAFDIGVFLNMGLQVLQVSY